MVPRFTGQRPHFYVHGLDMSSKEMIAARPLQRGKLLKAPSATLSSYLLGSYNWSFWAQVNRDFGCLSTTRFPPAVGAHVKFERDGNEGCHIIFVLRRAESCYYLLAQALKQTMRRDGFPHRKMSARFETLPRDILQTIAFLSASTSVFEPPIEVRHLLLTHPLIYQSICVASAPDLYAHIFFTKFDTRAPIRRFSGQLPDSAFAAELLARCRLLRRVHRVDFSSAGLKQDLWTALWMFLESDGLNERQLSQVKFSDFILGLARSELAYEPISHLPDGGSSLKSIIVWLLCLALRRRTYTPLHLFYLDPSVKVT